MVKMYGDAITGWLCAAGRAQRYVLLITSMLAITALLGQGYASTTTIVPNNAICAIYSVYTTVQTVIFILAIMLMLLGATLYAGSHLMPGQSRGTMQGYGMGMLMGGIAGVIITMLAPFVLQSVAGSQFTNAITGSGSSSVNVLTCA